MIENIVRQVYVRSGQTARLFRASPAAAAIQPFPRFASDRKFEFRPQTGLVRFMSGHSKWQNIKHTKAANDAARTAAFSKFGRMIKVAIREGKSNDPRFNVQLAHIVDVAKRANMPNVRIEGLLKEKTTPKDNLMSFIFEAKGPGGCFLIMEGLTDNLKRTTQTVRSYMNKVGGAVVENGAKHSFSYKGVIVLDSSPANLTLESAMDVAIEVGAEDVVEVPDEINGNNALQFVCEPRDFYRVKTNLLEKGFEFHKSELQYLPHTKVQLSDEHLNLMARLNDLIEEDPDITKCYDNIQ